MSHPVMINARQDLGANVPGAFSPAAWDEILAEAERRFDAHRAEGLAPEAAWPRVMREFHRERHWGHRADYRAPKVKRPAPGNFGVRFVVIFVTTATVSKMALAWFGQRWSATGEAKDKYVFLGVVALVLTNFAYFLWRTRHHRD